MRSGSTVQTNYVNQAKLSKNTRKGTRNKKHWILAVQWHEQCCHDASVPNTETHCNSMCSTKNYIDVRGGAGERRWHLRTNFGLTTDNGKNREFVWQNCVRAYRIKSSGHSNEWTWIRTHSPQTQHCVLLSTRIGGQYVYPLVPLQFTCIRNEQEYVVAWTRTKKTITACLNGKQQHNFQLEIYIQFILLLVLLLLLLLWLSLGTSFLYWFSIDAQYESASPAIGSYERRRAQRIFMLCV